MKHLILGCLLLLLCPPPGLGQAPGPVTDLAVSHTQGQLTVSFTAPTSLVAKFAIKYADAAANLQEPNFSNDNLNEELDQSDLLPGSTLTPTAPGSVVTIQVDPFEVFEGQLQYFFAMKTVNTAGLEWSAISNIVNVSLNQADDITPPSGVQDFIVTYSNAALNVTFTCSGDDAMGTDPVSKISLRYSTVEGNLNAVNFHNDNLNNEVDEGDLMPGSTLNPPSTGNKIVTLMLNPLEIFESAQEYFFAVKTADESINWSEVSNIDSVTTGTTPNPNKPAAVHNLAVTFTNGHLSVKFTSPATAISKFVIKYAESQTALEGVNFDQDNLNEELDQSDLLSGSLTPPSPGTDVTLHVDPFEVFEGQNQYFFAMKSEDASFQWSDTSNIAFVTLDQAGDVTPPAAIQDLAVTYNNGQLTVTFTCPGDDGTGTAPVAKISLRYATFSNNLDIVNFHNDNLNGEVQAEDLMSGSTLTPPVVGNSPVTITLNPLEIFDSAQEYFFAIKTADDSINWSGVSNIVSVLTGSNPGGPTTVTDLLATFQSGQLSLTFTAPAASPASQLAVSRFVIKYSHQSGYVGDDYFANDAYNDEIEVNDLMPGSSLVPQLPNSPITLQLNPYEIIEDGYTEYFFSMKSVDEKNYWSDISNIANVIAVSEPNPNGPTAVTDLQASYVNGQLSLKFTSPAASANSQFPVYRFAIKYSHQSGYVNDNYFTSDNYNDEIEVDDLLPGSTLMPPAPNTLVNLQLAPYEIFDDGHQEYFFYMKSMDSMNNWSVLSNIVSVVATTAPNPNGPTTVNDLRANYENGELFLTFTSPAASPNSQMAVSRFIIKYARSSVNVDNANFNNDDFNDEIEVDDLISGSSLIPPSPNTAVNLRLRANEVFDDDDIGQYYFSMKSVDNLNSYSSLSNIVSVFYNSSSNMRVNTYTCLILAFTYFLFWKQN